MRGPAGDGEGVQLVAWNLTGGDQQVAGNLSEGTSRWWGI